MGAEEADLVELRLLAHQQRRGPPDLMAHRDAQQQRPDHTQGEAWCDPSLPHSKLPDLSDYPTLTLHRNAQQQQTDATQAGA